MIFASDWAVHCGTGCYPSPATGNQDIKDYVVDARRSQ